MQGTSKNLVFTTQDHDIDFKALWQHLWQKKGVIILITLVTFSIGILYSSTRLPQFQTDVLLQIGSNKQGNSALGGLSKKLALATSSENSAATHSALIQSRFILEPVIQLLSLDLKVSPKQSFIGRFFFPKKHTLAVNTFVVPSSAVNQPFELVVGKNQTVSLYNKAGILQLKGQVGNLLSNADRSIRLKITELKAPPKTRFSLAKQSDADITHQLIKRLKIKDLGTREETGILQISLSGTNPRQMIRILDAIAHQAQLKDVEKKSLEASKALNFLNEQLPLAKKSLNEAENKLNNYRETSGKIDIKLQTQALLMQLEELDKQLSSLRVKKIDMLQQYTLQHPYLIALLQQVKTLKFKRTELEKKLKTLPASDQIAVNLMRDVKIKNSLYLILLSKIQELEFIKAGTVSNVRILSFAKLPDEPLPSHTQLIYGASLLLGLGLSFLLIFIKALFSSTIRDPYWVERHFNVVNLCIIPFCKEQTTQTKKLAKQAHRPLPLLAQISPRNLAIESLRSLRTSLQVSLSCAPNNIICLLGISSGVGKTFISSNLAWLLAAAGKRVLLIDGDLRRGIVHKKFNLAPEPGLVDLITQKVGYEKVLQASAQENLTILPRGSHPADPAELLMSPSFKTVMQELAQRFDLVIIDTAPVLQVTDGVLIAGIAGINYLVIGAGAHDAKEMMLVLKRLENAQIPLHGSIFNHYQGATGDPLYNKYQTYYDEEQRKERVFFTRKRFKQKQNSY